MEKDSFADRLAGWFGSEHPVRCFIARFVGAIAVATLLIAFVAGVCSIVDKANIAKRALDTFSHYSSSFPWLLLIVSFVLVLCIPGGPTALMRILRRIKKVGPVELFPAEDPDEETIDPDWLSDIVPDSTLKQLSATSRPLIHDTLKLLSPDQQKALLDKLSSRKSMKKLLVSLHAGRIGACIVGKRVRVKTSEQFFHAHLCRGDDHILIHLLSVDSGEAVKTAKEVKEIVETYPPSCPFVFHLVFYSTSHNKTASAVFDTIRKILFNVSNIRLYFYSVSKDNSIKPLEDIP